MALDPKQDMTDIAVLDRVLDAIQLIKNIAVKARLTLQAMDALDTLEELEDAMHSH